MTVEGKVPQNNINRHLGVLRNCEIMKLESLDIQQHIKGKIQQRENVSLSSRDRKTCENPRKTERKRQIFVTYEATY